MSKIKNFAKTWITLISVLVAIAGTGLTGWLIDQVKYESSGWVVLCWIILIYGCWRVPDVAHKEGREEVRS